MILLTAAHSSFDIGTTIFTISSILLIILLLFLLITLRKAIRSLNNIEQKLEQHEVAINELKRPQNEVSKNLDKLS